MDITFNLLVLGVALFFSAALNGAVLILLGVWVWYTTRLVDRINLRGSLYLGDFDNEQARKMNAAADVATGMEYMRQALRKFSPEMAQEFTREEPKKGKKK